MTPLAVDGPCTSADKLDGSRGRAEVQAHLSIGDATTCDDASDLGSRLQLRCSSQLVECRFCLRCFRHLSDGRVSCEERCIHHEASCIKNPDVKCRFCGIVFGFHIHCGTGTDRCKKHELTCMKLSGVEREFGGTVLGSESVLRPGSDARSRPQLSSSKSPPAISMSCGMVIGLDAELGVGGDRVPHRERDCVQSQKVLCQFCGRSFKPDGSLGDPDARCRLHEASCGKNPKTRCRCCGARFGFDARLGVGIKRCRVHERTCKRLACTSVSSPSSNCSERSESVPASPWQENDSACVAWQALSFG